MTSYRLIEVQLFLKCVLKYFRSCSLLNFTTGQGFTQKKKTSKSRVCHALLAPGVIPAYGHLGNV